MKNLIVIVLGGGRGTRLYPLTGHRAKPAVPIGGKYRLIDIPLSNCINSGLNKIYLLTQFNSASLHRHCQSFAFDRFGGGFVEILAAQQTSSDKSGWYQGTADAVRQNINVIEQRGVEHVLILSGDQLYQMDFAQMFQTHQESHADVTIAGIPVHDVDTHGLGVMRFDDTGRVNGFLEKPKTPAELETVRTSPTWIESQGIPAAGRSCVANMGIYLFNRKTLVDSLMTNHFADFGKEIFPAVIGTRKVQLHLFDGYWEDIGTIRSFYEANLALAQENTPFTLSHPTYPIYTRTRSLPPTQIDGATIRKSLVSDGCAIGEGTIIENSVIGLRCHIGKRVTIRNSIIMGHDYFASDEEKAADVASGRPFLGIGDDSVIDGAIVDKSCRIGSRVVITNPTGIVDSEEYPFGMIRDGIICTQKLAVFPDDWNLQEVLKK